MSPFFRRAGASIPFVVVAALVLHLTVASAPAAEPAPWNAEAGTNDSDRALLTWAEASYRAALRNETFVDAGALGRLAGLRLAVRLEIVERGAVQVDLIHESGPTLAGNLRTATVELSRRVPAGQFDRSALVLTLFPPDEAAASAFPTPELASGLDGLGARLGGKRVRYTPTDLWRANGDAALVFARLADAFRDGSAPPSSAAEGDARFAELLRKDGFRLERLPARVLARLAPEPGKPAPAAHLYRFVPLRLATELNAAELSRAAAAARSWVQRRAAVPAGEEASGDDAESLLLAALLLGGGRADPGTNPAERHLAARRFWEQALAAGYLEHPLDGRGYFHDRRGERSARASLLALRVLGGAAFVSGTPSVPAIPAAVAGEWERIAGTLVRYAVERGKRRNAPADAEYQASRLLAADVLATRHPVLAARLLTSPDAAGKPPADAPAPGMWLAAFQALAGSDPSGGEGERGPAALPEAILAGTAVYLRTRQQSVIPPLRAWCDQLLSRQTGADGAYAGPADEAGGFESRSGGEVPGATARSTQALATAAKLFAQMGERALMLRCAQAAQQGARALRQRQALDRFDLLWSADPEAARGGVRPDCADSRPTLADTAWTGIAFGAMGEGLAFRER